MSAALDGNVLAGMLEGEFPGDATVEPCRCRGCGDAYLLAEARVFVGAGLVVRCPGCSEVLAVVVGPDHELLSRGVDWTT